MSSIKRAILTGATGFVGHHLASRLLGEGWEVSAIVRPGSSLSRIPEGCRVCLHDGSSRGMLGIFEEVGPDVVFHVASQIVVRHGIGDLDSLVDSNLRLGLQLLEASVTVGCLRFVNTGTSWQHFENRQYDPVCLYAATKQAFAALIEYYANTRGLKAISLELNDTYGENDPRVKLVTLLLKSALSGAPLYLSPGDQLIDLVHVSDVAAAYLAADCFLVEETGGAHHVFAVKTDDTISVKQVAARIEAITGRTLHANWGARPYREREMMSPPDGVESVPGWKPVIPLDEGLRRLWLQLSQ